MKFRMNFNPTVFAMLWLALTALVIHDIAVRRAHPNTGASSSERVVTKEFVLVDDSGKMRARIGMSDNTNAPCVQLFDQEGQQRAQLRLNKDDVPSLRLYDGRGNVKSVLGFTLNDMNPSYVTFDANGIGHVENSTARNPYGWSVPVRDEDLMGRNVSSARGILSCEGSCTSLNSSLDCPDGATNTISIENNDLRISIDAMPSGMGRDPFAPTSLNAR